MNITMPSYFDLVEFKKKSLKEQMMHLLFFVTVVAELRTDMTSKILTHRLNDHGVSVNKKDVEKILITDTINFRKSPYTDRRDRNSGEVAYKLTFSTRKAMIKEINLEFAKSSAWKKPINIFLGLIIILSVSILLWIIAYHLSTNSGVDDLSWTQYKSRLHISELPMKERAKYLMYFITEHIKFKEEMTPEVISARLQDVGLGLVTPIEIDKYFKEIPRKIVPSIYQIGAYQISQEEKKRIESILVLKLPKGGDSLSFAWIAAHVQIKGIISIISILASICAFFLGVGYLTGRLAKIDEKLIKD